MGRTRHEILRIRRKPEIIRLVGQSALPGSNARWKSSASREPRSIAGTISIKAAARRLWTIARRGWIARLERIPDDIRERIVQLGPLDEPGLSPRELAVRFTGHGKVFRVRGFLLYRLLKAHDLDR